VRIQVALLSTLAAVTLVAAGCSTSTNEAENQTSANPETCAFDQSVDGVTAIGTGGETPQLVVAADAKVPEDLQVIDLCTGLGVEATTADKVTVDYVGVGYKGQKEFDSSYKRGEPATFPLSGVIPGWTKGVAGMKPGGARLLLIPADLAYAVNGSPPAIAPNEALAFIVELESVQAASPAAP
jgi:peptidylprolyl isomerase